MKLHNSYCYSTIDDVQNQLLSDPLIGDGWILTSAINDGTDITLTSSRQNQSYDFIVTPSECSQLGFANSYSGLTMSDGIEVFGLSMTYLAVCFVGKLLRRTL